MDIDQKRAVTDTQIRAAIDLKIAEQRFYWQRFVAFSALNAGIVALYAWGNALASSSLGLIISLAWLLFLWRSHLTNERLDPPYQYAKRQALGPLWVSMIEETTDPDLREELKSRHKTAFSEPKLGNWLEKVTAWALIVPGGAILVWLIALLLTLAPG